jgi:hypothetical protein
MGGGVAGENPLSDLRLLNLAIVAAAFVLFSAACGNPRRDNEVGAPPTTTQEAARVLTQELTQCGVRIRGVHASELELYFETDIYGEPAPPPHDAREWIGATLGFAEITSLGAVERDARGWLISIEARGGRVRFWLDSRDSALRALGALRRLSQR